MTNFDNEDCIIITFTDFNYLDIFNIFYFKFEKLKLNNLLVVSLDENTYKNLKKRNINTIYEPYEIKNNRYKFWYFRLNVINKIYKQHKKNIIHTDSDCIWFKNIMANINDIKNDYDIIGSIGLGHPQKIIKEYGFSLCCGFYFIKYSEKTNNLFDDIMNTNSNSSDDQVLFNTYIFDNKEEIIKDNKNTIICKNIILKNNLKIGIIKEACISRSYKKELFCYHPHLPAPTVRDKLVILIKRLLN